MGTKKIISVLLISTLMNSALSSTPSPPKHQNLKSRKDTYDEILRPPPPPPPLHGNIRVQHSSPGQRFQRQHNLHKQVYPLSQEAFGPSPFHSDRYPPITSKPKDQSFMQKISGWLFPPSNEKVPEPSYGPPPTFAAPPTYGPPQPFSSNIPPVRLQYSRQQNKNCNPCNYVPWIPVLGYAAIPNAPLINPNINHNYKSTVNINSQNGFRNGGQTHASLSPSKLSLPASDTYQNFALQSNKIVNNDYIGSPSVVAGVPASLSQIELNDNLPHSKPLKNSYGTPIAPNSYASPYPETNDNEGLQSSHDQKLFTDNNNNNIDHTFDRHQDSGKYLNLDNIEHLGTNNAPLLTKPTNINVSRFRKNNTVSPSSIDTSIEHNDDPSVRPLYRVKGVYNRNRGQILQPIPLPNLSPIPIPPIFNARPFKNNNNGGRVSSTSTPFTQAYDSDQKYPSTSSFQLVPSIPVAEFTSMIEYPISIIQSPLLEIDSTQNYKEQHKDESNQDQFNFNTNPIVVENKNKNLFDSYSAASGENENDAEESTIINDFDYQITTTEGYTKSAPPFLPTPNSFDTNSNENFKTRPPSFSYTYIDQTFYNRPTLKPQTSNNKQIITKFEGTPDPNPFKPSDHLVLQSIDSPLLYLKPNVPHKNSNDFNRDNNKYVSVKKTEEESHNAASSNTISSTSSPSAFRFIDNRYVPGRWPPPITDSDGNALPSSTKKPKRIQIIIPYTSQNQPSPFKYSNNNIIASSSGWVPMIDEIVSNSGRKVPASESNSLNKLHSTNSLVDYHESSESKIVSSSTPSFNRSRNNYDPKPYHSTSTNSITVYPVTAINEGKTSFDIKKLQKNIDDWTAQEYSKIYKRQQKSSTISHLKRSKKIPDEYFTTTVIPLQRKTSKSLLSNINELNGSFLDNEAAGSIQHSFETDLNKEKLIESFNNEILDDNSVTYTSQSTYYTTTSMPTTTPYIEITTYVPKTTTKHSWDKIQTSISPLTKERVYVVTPQPINGGFTKRENGNNTITKSNIITIEDLSNLTFKSPRFLVRPTPGPTGSQKEQTTLVPEKQSNIPISGFDWLRSINHLEETTTTENASNSLFGLSAVTSYTPPGGTAAVQTITGHSKVVTGVTASSVARSTNG